MQNKLLTIFSAAVLSSIYITGYASGYYSSVTVHHGAPGYYSSLSRPESGYYSHPELHHYVIAMNAPAYMGYVTHHTTYYTHTHARPYYTTHSSPTHVWVSTKTGTPLPDHAIVGGQEPKTKQALYVCRADYLGGTHPGKLEHGKCTFTYHGNEIRTDHYQLLISEHPLRWLPASYGAIPPHAIKAGKDKGAPLYICQANYHDGLIPGKVVGEYCHIGYEGRVINVPYYQVLVS